MARNLEKSRSLFSLWTSLVNESTSSAAQSQNGKPLRRPKLSSDCDSLVEAEKWRREIVRDAMQKIAAISNAANGGEYRIRELNDEINKTMVVKKHWERRIVELGGPNYALNKQQVDVEGKELPDSKGYKYYGAAKELPDVQNRFQEWEKELERRGKKEKKKSRTQLLKNIGNNPGYYQSEDDKNGDMKTQEKRQEEALVAEAVREYEEGAAAAKRRRLAAAGASKDKKKFRNKNGAGGGEASDEEEQELHAFLRGEAPAAITEAAGTAAPSAGGDSSSTSEINSLLVETKKSALLSKYM
jgi:pre-mRNA-splicing factor ISY1